MCQLGTLSLFVFGCFYKKYEKCLEKVGKSHYLRGEI